MNELVKILLSLSLSGAILIFALFLFKPLYKNKLSRQWQYYIWLIVVVRLLLPFTPESSLVGSLFQAVDNAIVQISTIGQPKTDSLLLPNTDLTEHEVSPSNQGGIINGEPTERKRPLAQSLFEMVTQNGWLICALVWLMVAIGLLIRKVTVYQSFVKYIKAGRVEVTDMRLWEQLGKLVAHTDVKTTVGLYTNGLISSPLLIGFFHPCIMLPTAELSDSDFQNTILHELAHYKRRDMFYKWLVQITICIHWFNPLVYLMGGEINRTCEFSCDEAVIRTLDEETQRAYGDTLINAIETGGNYNNSLASVTLNENAELLKERLDAIMRFKKTTRLAAAISIALVCSLCFGATMVGAYATNPAQKDYAIAAPTITQNDTKQGISVSAYNIIEYIEDSKKVNVFIEFKNNTKENIDLLYFNYEAFDSKGAKILTSQDNTNDLGVTFAAGKTIRVYLSLPETLSTINMRITKYQTQDGSLITLSNGSDNSYKLNFTSVPSLGNATDIKLEHYEFFTIEQTPAIKSTFKNNTDLDVTSVKVRIKFLNFNDSFHDYTAQLEIKAGESATHSGWGLVNGVTSIELGITSYVTTDGIIHEINSDDIEWIQLTVK